ncbi:hypothetical protein EXIGLDRAFT_771266 [Exidia glandulosa HHB12029]|uniref:Membrane anchor Opy2 N-terminal domain-containing protein n=1 Tax=Exidia glandulosa HHB12029 TaxID=1314781 RepID=A0A165G4S8_EXIGL|nr:hypothetical protein EXIGLDRAFT_771266 [Exidia glandulosa HHB12029]
MHRRRQDCIDYAACAKPDCNCSDTQYCVQTPYDCNQCPIAVCSDTVPPDTAPPLSTAEIGALGAGIVCLILLVVAVSIRVWQKRIRAGEVKGRTQVVPYLFAGRNAGTRMPDCNGPDATLIALRNENDRLRNALSWLQNQLQLAATESETEDAKTLPSYRDQTISANAAVLDEEALREENERLREEEMHLRNRMEEMGRAPSYVSNPSSDTKGILI